VPATRRQFLRGVGGVAGAVTLGRWLPRVPSGSFGSGFSDPAASGIDHVVVLMMENRSFDHILGWLPNANGRQAGLVYDDALGVPHATHHLQEFQGCAHPDPDHSFEGGRIQYNNGACDGWLKGKNDDFAIGYYLGDDLPLYGHLAPDWTVCDNYFAAIMAETYPNRFYQHAAQTDRLHNSEHMSYPSTLPTIWDRLAWAGLVGRYYYSDAPFTALWGQQYASISHPFEQFLQDCAAGTLPHVAFVDPRFLDEGSGSSADDHPHADLRVGQYFINQVYQAITTSPNWPRTVFVINYDEWGGFYDHVAPQVAPDANPAWGLRGFRVPCIVISPRARRGYVASSVYDHTSILKLIEWRWGLLPLTQRDANANNLVDVLDLQSPPNLVAPQYAVPQFQATPCLPATPGATSASQEQWAPLVDMAQRLGWTVPV
jgi:phospholipase C